MAHSAGVTTTDTMPHVPEGNSISARTFVCIIMPRHPQGETPYYVCDELGVLDVRVVPDVWCYCSVIALLLLK